MKKNKHSFKILVIIVFDCCRVQLIGKKKNKK